MIDLAFLLVAAVATKSEFVGVFCLHVGFLAYLESRHSHNGRRRVPKWLWPLFVLMGMFFYQKWEAVSFLACSYFYTKKNVGSWGILSPVFRGLQYFFLLVGIEGYGYFLPWLTLLTIIIRNFIGDLRDVEKDKSEGMKTLPIIVGIANDIRHGHLWAVVFSSILWWSFSCLSIWALFLGTFAQIATYKLTPR